MIDYIFKVLIFQASFLLIYDLLLKRETFFQWNRVYLLITPLISYVIPLIEVNQVSKSVPEEFMLVLPEVILSPESVIEQQVSWYTSGYDFLAWTLWLGGIIAAIIFVMKLYKLVKLILSNERFKRDFYYLILVEQLGAFSFFKYIFLSKELSDDEKQQVIDHELVHVRQWHSVDLLVFEVQRIIFWFNPFSYIYQHRIAMLHEYIADAKSIKPGGKQAYFKVLLNTAFGTKNISFINPFFEPSSIKKRIIMFNKARSRNVFKMKYAMVLPIIIAMLLYSSCENNTEIVSIQGKIQEELVLTHIQFNDGHKIELGELVNVYNMIMNKFGKDSNEGKKATAILDSCIDGFNNAMEPYMSKFSAIPEDGLLVKVDYDFSLFQDESLFQDISVPFGVMDQVPIFPDCEEQVDPKKCTTSYISLHVHKNFNSDISKDLDLEPGKKRVYVQFTIDKTGTITDVRARAPHERLEQEAIRVINTLPQMIPGEQKGKKVAVKYTLPITFVVN